MKKKRVMIIAGEASGDLHGANLVREALRLDPEVSFFGVGGPKMRAAGVDTVIDSAEMAVVGLVEVIAHFGVIYKAYTTLRDIIRKEPPDLLVLIDYPDFNLRIANEAKKAGVKVLYYISPQVWAWRVGRVKKIAKVVDRMAVVFPFEVPFYERAGVPVSFVGHPLADTVRPTMSKEEAFATFGLVAGKPVVGLFPGSRRGEIKMLLPVILQTARLLQQKFPDVQFILPLASTLTRENLAPYLEGYNLPITIIADRPYDVMHVCDAVISVSGTVTLELALMGIPMVIIYKVSPITYQVAKRVVKVDHAGICNIVAGERVVQELLQYDAEPEKIAAEISRLLQDEPYRQQVKDKLFAVKEKLGAGGASAKVANLLLDMVK